MVSEKQQNISDDRRKVLIVDDHPIVLEGLISLIEEEEDIVVCGSAENMPEAIKAIQTLEPDVVTVDISLQGASGLDLIKDIKVKFPNLPILALSVRPESFFAERAIRAGAKGYITKQEATKNVIMAIRKVLDGGLYLSQKMNDKLLNSLLGENKADANISPIDRLSDREFEVFLLLGHGRETRQIAEQLYISAKTVETYRLRIKEKLNIVTNSELLQHAFQWVNELDKCNKS
jgi:DNA-binding NarL/FixJ family response regulator